MRFIYNKLDSYIAIDIVEDNIGKNISKYQTEKFQFYSMDLTKDSLPVGDLILCRDCLEEVSRMFQYRACFRRCKCLLYFYRMGRSKGSNT